MEFQLIVVIQTQNKNFDMANSVPMKIKKRASKVLTVRFYIRFSCIQCKPLLTSLTIQYEWRYTISCVAIYRETILVVEILTHRCVCVWIDFLREKQKQQTIKIGGFNFVNIQNIMCPIYCNDFICVPV